MGIPGAARGFSLIELVLVILLLGALAGLGAVFIVQPFRAYDDVRDRTRLTAIAEQAVNRLHREVRLALPNSVRVASAGDRVAVEILPTTAGGRYRARPAGDGSGDPLSFTAPDAAFDVLGGLSSAPPAGAWVVVYNVSAQGGTANAYVGDNRAAVDGASTATSIALAAPVQFPLASPGQRFYVVPGAVSYVCDTGSGRLYRYDGYVVDNTQPVVDGDFTGGQRALVADRIAACDFNYTGSAASRTGLLTARLTLAEDDERVFLLDQVHVLNTP